MPVPAFAGTGMTIVIIEIFSTIIAVTPAPAFAGAGSGGGLIWFFFFFETFFSSLLAGFLAQRVFSARIFAITSGGGGFRPICQDISKPFLYPSARGGERSTTTCGDFSSSREIKAKQFPKA